MKQRIFGLSFLVLTTTAGIAQLLPIILDADTGNEMDDLYAIVKAIRDDSLEVTALRLWTVDCSKVSATEQQ